MAYKPRGPKPPVDRVAIPDRKRARAKDSAVRELPQQAKANNFSMSRFLDTALKENPWSPLSPRQQIKRNISCPIRPKL